MRSYKQASRAFSESLKRGLLASCLAAFLALVCGLGLGVEALRLRSFSKEKEAITARLETVGLLRDAQMRLELVCRGVLLTGADATMQALRAERQRWRDLYARLSRAGQTDPARERDLARLAEAVSSRFTELERDLESFRMGGQLSPAWIRPEIVSFAEYERLESSLEAERRALSGRGADTLSCIHWLSAGLGLSLLALWISALSSFRAALKRVESLTASFIHGAAYDAATGLASRRYLLDWLKNQISSASRMDDGFHVLLLGVDGMDGIDSKYGVELGNQLLLAIAKKFQGVVRPGDFAARQADARFVMVFSCAPDSREVGRFAASLLRTLRKPLVEGLPAEAFGANIGVASYPEDGRSPGELIRSANKAMLQARQGGRFCYAYRRGDGPLKTDTETWEFSRF